MSYSPRATLTNLIRACSEPNRHPDSIHEPGEQPAAAITMKATHVSPAAIRWLETSSSIAILHVFDSACNFINSEGEILSLVGADVGPGPFAVVCPLPRAFTWSVVSTSSASIVGSAINLGPLTIETAGASLWDPVPDWPNARRQQQRLLSLLPAFRRALPSHPDVETALSTEIANSLAHAATTLLGGINEGNEAAYRDGARRLAGLGTGLTPTGDDFLMGVIFALWATHPEVEAGRLADTISETAAPRTTALSGAWLRAAARGEAAQPWHDLVDSLAQPDCAPVNDALMRIMSIGHRSGIEAVSGFIGMLAAQQ